MRRILEELKFNGLSRKDPRLASFFDMAGKLPDGRHSALSFEQFEEMLSLDCGPLLERTLKGTLVVPSFPDLTAKVDEIYEEVRTIKDGANASYIPQLADIDPNLFAVAISTVDGQFYGVGDTAKPFCA